MASKWVAALVLVSLGMAGCGRTHGARPDTIWTRSVPPPAAVNDYDQRGFDLELALRSLAARDALIPRSGHPNAPRATRGTPRSRIGGDVLSRIAQCESHGNPTDVNRTSGAGGIYQYLPSTWNNYAGFARAQDAPPEVQEARARADLARIGTRPWASSRHCWG